MKLNFTAFILAVNAMTCANAFMVNPNQGALAFQGRERSMELKSASAEALNSLAVSTKQNSIYVFTHILCTIISTQQIIYSIEHTHLHCVTSTSMIHDI